MPEISIIIPVYNAERYISRCMDSVLRQTYQDFEVILVNDGSTDASLDLCNTYRKKDPRVIVLDKKNGGAASARNLGMDWAFEHSESKWICFVDVDDFIHQRYLEYLLYTADNEHSAISMCSYEVTNEDHIELLQKPVLPMSVPTEELWCERQVNCTVPVAKLFQRELFQGIRFPEGIIHEDEFTLYRVLFQCEKIAFLDLPLYGYFQTETSVMRGKWTPRHMSEPDGLREQLIFFSQNHYENAASYTAKIYLLSLYRNYLGSKESGAVYQKETAALKKRLKNELPRLRKMAGLSIKAEDYLYYAAFPALTLPYRAYRKIMGKLRKG